MSWNGDDPATQTSTKKSNFNLLSILSKEKLTCPNYMDWIRNLKMTIRYEKKFYVLKNPLLKIDETNATPDEIAFYNKHDDNVTKVACIMFATMVPELQKFYEDYWSYEM